MAFGAYPKQSKRTDMSLKRPLLDKASASSEASDDTDYQAEPHFLIPYERTRRRSRCVSLSLVLTIGAGVSIILFQTLLLWNLWRRQHNRPDILGELNGLVPLVGAEDRLFVPDLDFNPLNLSDIGWERVMPKGGGFVSIPSAPGAILPEAIHTYGKNLYNVAVFHQLHCLHVLAEEFDNLLGGRDLGAATPQPVAHDSHSGGKGEQADGSLAMYHIRHCFEYIKTSLTCCADTALEGQKSDIDQPAADGFGAYHVCRDFDAVFQWAEAHRGSEQIGYPH